MPTGFCCFTRIKCWKSFQLLLIIPQLSFGSWQQTRAPQIKNQSAIVYFPSSTVSLSSLTRTKERETLYSVTRSPDNPDCLTYIRREHFLLGFLHYISHRFCCLLLYFLFKEKSNHIEETGDFPASYNKVVFFIHHLPFVCVHWLYNGDIITTTVRSLKC